VAALISQAANLREINQTAASQLIPGSYQQGVILALPVAR
jgi:hypothetical protein